MFSGVISVAVMACGGGDTLAPSKPPAKLEAVSALSRTTSVGASVVGGIVVNVADADGRPVQGASVAFAVTLGNGSTNPRIAVTDSKGQATASWTLGTIVGSNEVTASVSGVVSVVKFTATGTAGAVAAITFSTPSIRLVVNVDTARISAKSFDLFGNATSPPPVFTVRDPTLLSVDAGGLIRVLRRGAGTYVIATAGAKTDSVFVTVLAVGQSICTGAATPVDLAVGQVLTDVSGSGFCVHSSSADAEYAVVPFYNSNVPSASTTIEIRPQGISALASSSTLTSPVNFARSSGIQQSGPELMPNDAFESRLRDRERVEGTARLAGARDWMTARRNAIGARASAVAVPAIGDILKLNVNSSDFCDNPDVRTGRVVAITDKAIMVADTNNPIGGFTTEEYRSFGVTFDTLIDPLDRAMFGTPSDVDANGRTIMFFTRAVNEITPPNSGSVTLGFFYRRDLYPKAGTTPCAGSNGGEMFYLLVPDTGGVVNGNKRTHAQVTSFNLGTIAHEYQHLINSSRRLYVNVPTAVFEEKWLDEGLSHIAEDLNFWASSGLTPRSNVDNKVFLDPRTSAAYTTFARFNTQRYSIYLPATQTQSPVGFNDLDDDLATRGAIWSFLRFTADHLPAGTENAFWFNLVNSKTSGIANLTNVLGKAPNSLLRDWAISVYMDDKSPGVDVRFQQPSWNMRSIITNGGTSILFPVATRILFDGVTSTLTLGAYGVSFSRFAVASGQDALVVMTSGGQPLPETVQVSVVRIR